MAIKRLTIGPRNHRARTWPEGTDPDTGTVFSGRLPHLPELVVMIDAELLREPPPSPFLGHDEFDPEGLLSGLLLHKFVRLYRYADNGPPPSVRPEPPPEERPVHTGWVVLDPPNPNHPGRRVVFFREAPTSYTTSAVIGNAADVAAADTTTDAYRALDAVGASERRRADGLAEQVAEQGVHADVYVTRREYLAKATRRMNRETTVCTPEEALTLVSLYLRQQGEFIAAKPDRGSEFVMNRGLFYWVAAGELLPEAWRWFAACAQHSAKVADDRMTYLGQSLLQRVARALEARDAVHVSSNQPQDNDLKDEALANIDEVLVLLMGAVDVTARVAHKAAGLPDGDVRHAGWQNQRWLRELGGQAPRVAELFVPESQLSDVITVLRLLRNSVHGVALQGLSLMEDNRPMRNLVGLPQDDEAKLLEAIARLGGCKRWSVVTHPRPLGSIFEPATLVDVLFEHVIKLLNAVMSRTPVEDLEGVHLAAEHLGPPSARGPNSTWNPFEEWTRLSIRWQLGF